MDVLSAASGDQPLWVRGPTAQDSVAAPATPAGPAAPARPAAPSSWSEAVRPPGLSGHEGHQVAWVGAHGGAGASTLARELGGADVGRRWPDPARGEPGRVLLVARTHATGMRAASRALDSLRKEDHPPGVQLLALVLVADAAGLLPITLGRRVRVLRSAAPVLRLPWIPAWRLDKPARTPPREVRRLAELVAGRPR